MATWATRGTLYLPAAQLQDAGARRPVPRIAIICALEDEVRPLIRQPEWREWTGVQTPYRSYECRDAVLMCAGIGAKAVRRAAEAVLQAEGPRMLISAGFAGALAPWLKGGDLVLPTVVVSEATGTRFTVPHGNGFASSDGMVLVSTEQVARQGGKAELFARHRAQAVDMEAAVVAEVAQQHGVGFMAVKAISDESDLAMPDMDRFVDEDGRFQTARFVLHAAVRPELWSPVSRLASNRGRASETLCRALLRLLETRPVAERGSAATNAQSALAGDPGCEESQGCAVRLAGQVKC
jgi:adenosylhomocysteine nucleosidase